MPCNLYGVAGEYPVTRDAALKAGWHVILNDSLATTAIKAADRLEGATLLVSFGSGKTIDAGGGGAILTDDGVLSEAVAHRIASWPVFSPSAAAIENHLMLARRHLRALSRPDLGEPLLTIDAANTRYALPPHAHGVILAAVDALPEKVDRLRHRTQIWTNALESLEQELLNPHGIPAVPWRLVRRVRNPELRDPLLAWLRDRSVDVGTNYPPLWETYPLLLQRQFNTKAEAWGRGILNFWLTENYTDARIFEIADMIRQFLANHQP
jgi:dTDP-4-amino-4,6-dideoxygalactose transaminase